RRYLAPTRTATDDVAARLLDAAAPEPREEVTLTDFDPDGEVKVVAAALYAASTLPDDERLDRARKMTHAERRAVLDAYVGERLNRRHRPGRAFERTSYRFDILGDYGAFRDLQRHRLLTLEWQRLAPRHGAVMPEAIAEAGAEADWRRVLAESADLHDAIAAAGRPEVASYAVSMAYRVRFYMELNAREASSSPPAPAARLQQGAGEGRGGRWVGVRAARGWAAPPPGPARPGGPARASLVGVSWVVGFGFLYGRHRRRAIAPNLFSLS